MEGKIRKYNGQVEINDLLDDAVKNAVERRHQALNSEDALSALSNEEANSIVGGITLATVKPPIIIGLIITTGIIVAPTFKS